MNLFKESVEFNIPHLTEFLNVKQITGAAFCLAREKIKNVFFEDLNELLIRQITENNTRTWKNFRVLAFDGTTASLPASRQIKNHFGIHSTKEKGTVNCLAQCLFCVDVLSDYILGYRLDKLSVSEKQMFREMLPNIPVTSPTIFLLDRGFGCYNVVNQFISMNQHFCIRMSVSMTSFAKMVMDDPREDFVIDWIASKKESQKAKKYNLNPALIPVRVTKVVLSTGETELLVSNLFDLSLITKEDMKELYFKRWSIEESIKKMKPKLKLEFWGARKERGIQQEFLANIFMYNLSCYLGNVATLAINKKTKHRRLKYKYNWQNAYRFTRDKMIQLCFSEDIAKILESIIVKIERSIIAIIDGRSFPRNQMKNGKSRAYTNYK